MLTMYELANQLGVKYYQISYAHRSGQLPEPTLAGGRRVYSAKDVEQVRKYFAERRDGRKKAGRPTKGGNAK